MTPVGVIAPATLTDAVCALPRWSADTELLGRGGVLAEQLCSPPGGAGCGGWAGVRGVELEERAVVGVTERLDAGQRRNPAAGFPLGVLYKYIDDQGGYLAALIAYYAFL